MSEPFLGQISLFGFNFAPRGWSFCNGQLLSVSQYSALFSLLGTNFGGDGRSTFGLPDLRGRVPLGFGQGPGLPNYVLGQKGGADSVTLTGNNIPTHDHPLMGSTATVSQDGPSGNVLGSGDRTPAYAPATASLNATFKAGSVGNHPGGNLPVNVMQPYLALNYSIAMQGLFPSRS